MKRLFCVPAALGCLAVLVAVTSTAWAGEGSLRGHVAAKRAAWQPWHANYYDAAWGMPVAMVVPPTAESQTHYSWGVPSSRVTGINHQFHRNFGPSTYDRRAFLPTPPWPSSTDQLGYYYVRGPW
jgi:hypothetical protein